MPIDGMAAAKTLQGYAPLQHHGACLYYVWNAYDAQGADTKYPAQRTAYQAYQLSDGKHPGDRNPPPGVPVWWGRRRSDGNMDGDVTICLGDRRVRATDQPTWGNVGDCTIAEREKLLDREYLGWTECIFEVPIQLPPPAPAPASVEARPAETPEEDPMPESKTVDYRPQTLKAGEEAYLEIDTKGHIAALAGPATVTGNFYVAATGSPIMVDALAQKVDGKGRPTSTRFISSGTVEAGLPDSIPVDGVLEAGEFLRFRVRKPKTEVKIAHASARLLYWVG